MSDSGTSGGAVPFTRVAIPTSYSRFVVEGVMSASVGCRSACRHGLGDLESDPRPRSGVDTTSTVRNPHAGQPFTTPDEQIAQALLDVSIPTLMLSLVHRPDDGTKRSQAEMRKMVWSQPSVKHSFYKNAFGEVHILSPWRLVDYWRWTREPNPDDFVIR